MALIVKIKTRKQEKTVKKFLVENNIEFLTLAEEDAAAYKTKTKKPITPKEKKILANLDQSIDFVNKYKMGKTKTKSLNQLLNEL